MAQRSIEVKVGLMILGALVLLAAFVVVLGGINFQPTYTVYVAFENPGGLQAGAPVRLASIRIGKVKEIQFRGGEIDPQTRRPSPPIRAVVAVEERYQASIFQNSRWYVTTQGVLGETYLAVETGTSDQPVLKDGSVVQGVSPPRLDLLLAESYELLHRAYVGITNNDQKIAETFDHLHQTLGGTARFFRHNQGKLDNIVDNVDGLTAEAKDAVAQVRERYVNNPQIDRILGNVDRTTSALNQNLPPLLDDARSLVNDGQKLTAALATPEQLKRYDQITRDAAELTASARRSAQHAEQITARVRQGEGTVGALLADEALYDDIQELVRDLKRNPWKFFWKE